MVWEPAVSEASVQVATPVVVFTGTEQMELPLSVKVMVPEKVVFPLAPETVAVKVTDWLTAEVLAEERMEMEVLPGLTTWLTGLLLLPVKSVSPL